MLVAAASVALSAFLAAWAKVESYTCEIAVHETKGSQVQDRTYRYAYRKPHFARIDITGGPGRGGGAVWKGGDTIVGHRGGAISFIRLTRSIHDAEAVDLRGGTIDRASFADMVEALSSAPSQTTTEETRDGMPVDVVTIPYTDANGATKRSVVLSRATHLPVERVTYAGEAVVEDERFTNVNTNAHLTEHDFER
jgi:outer membrane lipoprotein-sorting protein